MNAVLSGYACFHLACQRVPPIPTASYIINNLQDALALFPPLHPPLPTLLSKKKKSSLVPVLEGKGDMPKLISVFKVVSRLLPCAVGTF